MDAQIRPTSSDPTIDSDEIAQFNSVWPIWWDEKGPARWLHRYNPLRLAYIRDAACLRFGFDPDEEDCLAGLHILDIGCGGGVLCEPLAQLGATVTGIDPAPNAIDVARMHARRTGAHVDYRCATADMLAAAGERFDLVLAMEVIEHVADSRLFLQQCAGLLHPGGLAILSTINRTLKSYAFAIVVGEYVLRLLPRGTHQWKKFVPPHEMGRAMKLDGLTVTDVSGVTLNLRSRNLRLSHKLGVNYMLTAMRPEQAGQISRASMRAGKIGMAV